MAKEELTSNRSATIGTDAVVVSEECFQQRSAIIITNTSTGGQIITISIGETATTGKGIVLSPGGVYQDSRDGQYMPSNKQIQAVSNAAAGTIAVHERILTNTIKGW